MKGRCTRYLLLIALALALTGCPKDGDTQPTPPVTQTDGTPAPTEAPEPGATTITYHWSGGFSIFEFYTMTIVEKDKQLDVAFAMKPVKGEQRSLKPTMEYTEYEDLSTLLAQASFHDLEQKPRGMKIMDIGRTVISVTDAEGKSHEVYEDPDTTTSGDLKDVRLWFDRHVREYLNAISKPNENGKE